jgi:hypothetical protein
MEPVTDYLRDLFMEPAGHPRASTLKAACCTAASRSDSVFTGSRSSP